MTKSLSGHYKGYEERTIEQMGLQTLINCALWSTVSALVANIPSLFFTWRYSNAN